jgi:hypothetical protein
VYKIRVSCGDAARTGEAYSIETVKLVMRTLVLLLGGDPDTYVALAAKFIPVDRAIRYDFEHSNVRVCITKE